MDGCCDAVTEVAVISSDFDENDEAEQKEVKNRREARHTRTTHDLSSSSKQKN